MMLQRMIFGLVAGGMAMALSACGTSSVSFRYRMIVEGSESNSAVYELLAEKVTGPQLPDERPGGSVINGEALVIDTPSGPVFLLLRSEQRGGDLKGAIVRALASDIAWDGQPSFWKAVNRLSDSIGIRAKLPRTEWPLIVRFRDISNPMTVEQVAPEALGIKRILVETTGEDPTTGIEDRLPWLGNDPLVLGKDGSMGPAVAGEYINNRSFWNGIKK